jgi:dienelactone hydrolase
MANPNVVVICGAIVLLLCSPSRISPMYHTSSMRAPLIIAQGANDPRVKRAESDQIYNALKGQGLEVQYFLYEGKYVFVCKHLCKDLWLHMCLGTT